MQLLNILPATAYPRVTDHIQDIDEMVTELLERKNAYVCNGSIYFRVNSFQPQHGILASPSDGDWKADKIDPSVSLQRRGEDDKDDPRDFALWKASSPADGGVSWASKHLGTGRPGKHSSGSILGHCKGVSSFFSQVGTSNAVLCVVLFSGTALIFTVEEVI